MLSPEWMVCGAGTPQRQKIRVVQGASQKIRRGELDRSEVVGKGVSCKVVGVGSEG